MFRILRDVSGMRCRVARAGALVGGLLLAGALPGGCGSAEDGVVSGNQPDAAGVADTGWPDSSGDAGAPDAPAVPPTPRAPCDTDACWLNAPTLSGACGSHTVNEDFSTLAMKSIKVNAYIDGLCK
jgi:hypothetical protein